MIPLFLFSVPLLIAAQQSYVSVPTSQGTVQGKTVNYGNDRSQLYYGQADAFLGIPYAQPPTGNLRFQAPQPMGAYPTPVYDATYYRPKCPQASGGSYVNEDCLYLNVFTQQANNSAAMAVMVFVDGADGLQTGGTDQSQLKGTVRNLVSRGVVVVTFQYRLGALGFFSSTAVGFQANNGMLDQVMVLQWVQQNIRNFGGNPNQVTLCGQGDGACAVNAHTLSPMSQNLFQQAIIQSGTIYNCYSPDGTVPVVSQPTTTPMPTLQYDQGLQYTPLDQGGYQSNSQNQANSNAYQGYYGGSQSNGNYQQNDGGFQFQGQNSNNQNQQSSQNSFQYQGTNSNSQNQQQQSGFQFTNGYDQNQQTNQANQGGFTDTNSQNQQQSGFQFQGQSGYNQNQQSQGGFQFTGQPSQQNQNQQGGFQFTLPPSPQNQAGFQGGQSQQQNTNYNQNQFGGYQQKQGAPYTTAQSDPTFVNPSQELAQQLCNVSASQWNSGNVGNLKNCLNNYSVDFIVQTQGQKVATWLIVRDNSFFPGTPEQLASRRPPIPIIIGTVQDEDADYAFKLVANGNASQNEGDMLNNWMVDFARKNKVSNDPQAQGQIENIIGQNYNITPSQPTYSTTPFPQFSTTTGQRIYDYSGQNQQYNNNQQFQNTQQYSNSQYQNQNSQQYQNSQTGYSNQQSYPNQQLQQYDPSQPMSPSTVQSLRTMSTITSDSGITSQTATAIDSFVKNGNTMVRVYQFTYVTNLNRQGQPNMGSWQPVTKGTDQVFLFMSETVWNQGNPTQQDVRMADQVGQQWTDFAKSGQVNNWQPTNGQNYNYCNLAATPTQQTGYGAQARDVFQQQVQPIVTQSQVQQGLIPQRDAPQYTPQPQQSSNCCTPPQYQQNCCMQQQQYRPPQAQYSQNGDSSNFQISFSLSNNLPYNG